MAQHGVSGKVTWSKLTSNDKNHVKDATSASFGSHLSQHFTDMDKTTVQDFNGPTKTKPDSWKHMVQDIATKLKLEAHATAFKETVAHGDKPSMYRDDSILGVRQVALLNRTLNMESKLSQFDGDKLIHSIISDRNDSKGRSPELIYQGAVFDLKGYKPIDLNEYITLVAGDGLIIMGEVYPQGLRVILKRRGGEATTKFMEITPVEDSLKQGPRAPSTNDGAYDVARDAGAGDFDYLGEMDDWINSGGFMIDNIPNHYASDSLIWEFWVNDVFYANNRHRGNDKETRPGQGIETVGWVTRVVVNGQPVPLNPTTTTQPDKITRKTWRNATSSDKTEHYEYSSTSGTSSTITVDKSSSFTVDASVAVGGFSMNASGTTSSSESKTNTSDNTTTTSVSGDVLIKAWTEQTLISTVSQVNVTDYYTLNISLRGKDNRPTVGVCMAPGHESEQAAWLHISNFGKPVGNRATSDTKFRVESTITTTVADYVETQIPH